MNFVNSDFFTQLQTFFLSKKRGEMLKHFKLITNKGFPLIFGEDFEMCFCNKFYLILRTGQITIFINNLPDRV